MHDKEYLNYICVIGTLVFFEFCFRGCAKYVSNGPVKGAFRALHRSKRYCGIFGRQGIKKGYAKMKNISLHGQKSLLRNSSIQKAYI